MTSKLLFVVLFQIHLILSLKECIDFEQCKARTIIDSGISCSGYSSCRESQLIKSTNDISCTGLESCRESKLRAKGSVYCDGSAACYNGYNGQGTGSIRARIITCGGSNACSSYNDNEINAKTLLYCSGFDSCSDNYAITVGKNMYCNGNHACEESQVKIGL